MERWPDVGEEKASAKLAASRYLDAISTPTPNGQYSQSAISTMQNAIFDALRSGDPLPGDMRFDLACAFEELIRGVQPVLLSAQRGPGRPEHPINKLLRKDAIRYIRWVADGRIVDANPIAAVARAFGVHTKTVELWLAEWDGVEIEPMVFEDDDLRSFEDSDGNTVMRDLTGLVKVSMRASGARYKALRKPLIRKGN